MSEGFERDVVCDTLRRTIETLNLAFERGDMDSKTGSISYDDADIGHVTYECLSAKKDAPELVQSITVDRYSNGTQSIAVIDYTSNGLPDDIVVDSLSEFNAVVGGSDPDDEPDSDSEEDGDGDGDDE